MTSLAELRWPLRTQRLVLRPATQDDVEAIWSYRRLDEVAQWLSRSAPDLAGLRDHLVRPDRLADTLVVELDGEVVGDLMVRTEDGWAQAEVSDQARGTQAEIGWAFAPTAGGRGLATEAVRAVLDLAFEGLGLRRVTALCFADNVPSWRLMERLGMRREGHMVRESLHRTEGWLDGYAYALLADEWREQVGGEGG